MLHLGQSASCADHLALSHRQLIMRATNPRDVAHMFRDYARKIHAKSTPKDPSFVKISITCGKVRLSSTAQCLLSSLT